MRITVIVDVDCVPCGQCGPQHFYAAETQQKQGVRTMAGVKASWTQDTSPGIASYTIFFTRTPAGSGTPDPTVTINVPRSATGDASGYSVDYNSATPTPPALANGDSVAVQGESINAGGQISPVITATGSPVVISGVTPPPPPTGPVGLTAAQS